MKLIKTVLVAATTLLFTVSVNADSIRCGSHDLLCLLWYIGR